MIFENQQGEVFRLIENSKYLVSNLGRVYSFNIYDFLSPYMFRFKYLGYSLRIDNKYKTTYIHRLIASNFIANPNNYPVVNHINGITTDNRIENIEWCTQSYNVQHAYDTGLTDTSKRNYKGRVAKQN